MTPQELNRDIRKLAYRVQRLALSGELDKHKDELSAAARRLYLENDTFKHVTKNNVLIMIRLNLVLRYYPFHLFGSAIEIN